jgi:hypothetical protein
MFDKPGSLLVNNDAAAGPCQFTTDLFGRVFGLLDIREYRFVDSRLVRTSYYRNLHP